MFYEDKYSASSSEEKIRDDERKSLKKDREVEDILDHAFILTQFLEDDPDVEVLSSLLFFIKKYDFPMRQLPGRVYDKLCDIMEEEEKVSHYESEAILSNELSRAYEYLGY